MSKTCAVRADANVRICAHSAMIKSSVNTSTFQDEYAALPTGSNQGPVIGVTAEHFFEPNFFGFKQGTDPTTITGTTPTAPYNMQTKPVAVYGQGDYAYVYAAGAVNQGDVLVVADVYGRVNSVTNLSIANGTEIFPVGVAQGQTTGVNQLVKVALNFTPLTL